ncbi:MAG: alpha/beta hydrolase [Streptomyces sp.]|nr:alpha/beta hydrolase [Streptomyces sp.]
MSRSTSTNPPVVDTWADNARDQALEVVRDGTGAPVTLMAHSAMGSIKESWRYGAGVPGTKVAFHFPGYGASAHPGGALTLDAAADSVGSVARRTGATRAVGVSLGASAVLRAMIRDPGLFSHVALILPFAADTPVPPAIQRRYNRAVAHGLNGNLKGAVDLVRPSLPPHARFDALADSITREAMRAGTFELLGTIPTFTPVPDRAVLSAVTARVLVIGHAHDPYHSLDVATRLSAAIPDAELHLAAPRSALTGRAGIARRLARFFDNPAPPAAR